MKIYHLKKAASAMAFVKFSARDALNTSNGAFQVRIQSGKAILSCTQAYNFKISPASKVSDKKPSTNVPIQCRFCADVHWKYNVRCHLQERHPSWETNVSATELKIFSDSISMSNDEEIRLGIPEIFHGCSIIANEVYDNRRLNALPTVRDTHGDSPQRT